ncbi:MAG: branched-chain amino acid ABC transporter permease [Nitrososphaerota archaeon]|nr:branched-chain amino acid ABC transporter permease [Nitrososphaerota archaeon]
MFFDLVVESVVLGIFLGGFYMAMSAGLTVSFGLVGIVNVAHPTLILIASYIIFVINGAFGIDPVVSGLLLAVPFFGVGVLLYLGYDRVFSARSEGDAELIGLVFFFGLLVVLETVLLMVFGVTEVGISTPYSTEGLVLGSVIVPDKFVIALAVGLAMILGLYAFFTRTFTGRAVRAVADDQVAATLMGVRPRRVRAIANGFAVATAAVAGGLLIAIEPISPGMDVQFVGLAFAIVIFGGRKSILGTLIASIILGVATNTTAALYSPGLSQGVAYAVLLAMLILRPSGLLRR